MQGLLTDEQARRWPIFERDRRRHLWLGRTASDLAGEKIDLIEIVDGLDLPDDRRRPLDHQLHIWADEVDVLLIRRMDLRDWLRDNDSFAIEQGETTATMEDHYRQLERLRETRIALRHLTFVHAHRLAESMEVEDGRRFLAEYLERCFPAIYGPTAADSYLERLLTMNDLAPDQTETLEALRERFEMEVEALNRQLAEIRWRREEEDRGLVLSAGLERPRGVLSTVGDGTINGRFERAVFYVRENWEPDTESPNAQLRRRKNDLVRRTIEAAHALLTVDQQDRAPVPKATEMLTLQDRVERRLAALVAEKRREAEDERREPNQAHMIVVTLDD